MNTRIIQDQNNVEDIYPMSDIQKGMVLHTMLDNHTLAYLRHTIYQVKFTFFDPLRFKKAFSLLVDKHPILRTAFNMFDFEEPVQIVYKSIPPDILLHFDISHLEKSRQEDYLINFIAEEREKAFNPSQVEPLWKIRTFDLGVGNIGILWVMHHALIDGLSSVLLMNELNSTYTTLKTNPAFIPKKLSNTYKAFVVEQIIERRKRENINYWKTQLKGYKKLEFSATKGGVPDSTQGTLGEKLRCLDTRMLELLKNAAVKYNSSLKNLCFGAYFYMVGMLSYENDVVVGLVTHSRPLCPDGDKIIGCFLNSVPVRIKIPTGIRWSDYIRLIEKKTVELKKYDRLSLMEIVKISGENHLEKNPIFDTTFNYTDYNLYNAFAMEPKSVEKDERKERSQLAVKSFDPSDIPLDVIVNITPGGLDFSLKYDKSYIDTETAGRLCAYFENVLQKMIYEPETIAAKDEILLHHEKRRLLYEFNHTAAGYDWKKNPLMLVEEQAAKVPQKTAVVCMNARLTYDALNEQSGRLAQLLKTNGAAAGCIVGLMPQRSLEMIIGLLAVLKTGAAYLPIDPGFPRERIKYMLSDSRVDLLLTNSKNYETAYTSKIIDLDRVKERKGDVLDSTALAASPEDPIYVIYTSGSTGKPKGVIIKNRSVVNFIKGITDQIDFNPDDSVLSLTTIAFDIFVLETLLPLVKGCKVTVGSVEEQVNPGEMAFALERENITILQATPSRLKLILSDTGAAERLRRLKCLVVGGEALPASLLEKVRDLADPKGKIYNVYGPTETTIWSTIKNVSRGEALNIGKPIANTRVYILGRGGDLQPPDVIGELCIEGDGLAHGYLNHPHLTAEKFSRGTASVTSSPLSSCTPIYHTGDLARWLPDGNIECLGRIDHQVKIRGFRIELAEIENFLQKHPHVKEALVSVKIDQNDEYHLCAFVVPAAGCPPGGIDVPMLREYLGNHLPDYMLPSLFVPLEKIPLTPNGKIDRNALPDPEFLPSNKYTPPRDQLEVTLTHLWSRVLQVEKDIIGIDDGFIERGGHSISAILLMSKIQQELDVKVPLTEIFKSQTIRELAEYIKQSKKNNHETLKPVEKKEYYPLSSAQKRVYTHQAIEPQSINYNLMLAASLEGSLDGDKLEETIAVLIKRHEAFRTSFHMVGNELVQKIADYAGMALEKLEMSEPDADNFIRDFMRPFDLGRAPLMRVKLIKTAAHTFILLIDIHHIIADGFSMQILIKEFLAIYGGEKLPPLTIQYKEFVEALNTAKGSRDMLKQEEYWLKEFERKPGVLNIPTDFGRPMNRQFNGENYSFEVNETDTLALKKIALEEGATFFMVLLALLNMLLSKLGDSEDIVIGTPIAGRLDDDLQYILGMFVNTLALRNYPRGEMTFREFLREVKTRALASYENQDYPFDCLVDKLMLKRDTSRHPLFDVIFTLDKLDLHALEIPKVTLPGLTAKGYGNESRRIIFDLVIFHEEVKDKIMTTVQYAVNLFKRDTIREFTEVYKKIIAQVTANKDIKLKDIEIAHQFSNAVANFSTADMEDFDF